MSRIQTNGNVIRGHSRFLVSVRCGIALLVSALSLAIVSGATYFVAPEGNDANNGSEATPFATVQKGVDVARAGDTVRLAPGVYRETVTFRRSGEENAPITLEGADPRTTVLSAADKLSGKWSPSPLHPRALQIKLEKTFPADYDQSTQVYWNGKALTLARWPNLTPEGVANPSFANRQWVPGSENRFENFEVGFDDAPLAKTTQEATKAAKRVREFTFRVRDPKLPEAAKDWVGARIYMMPGIEIWSWTITGRLTDIPGKALTYKTLYNTPDHGHFKNGFRYWIEDHPKLLDAPGEWWIDPATHTLHLIPPGATKPENELVEIRARELAIIVDEKSNIVIRNLGLFGGGITTDLRTNAKFFNADGRPAWRLRNEKTYGVATGKNVRIDRVVGLYLTNFVFQEGHTMFQWGGAISLSGQGHTLENSILQFSDGPMVVARGLSANIRNNVVLDTNLRATVSEAVIMQALEGRVENNTVLRTARSAIRAEPHEFQVGPWGGVVVSKNDIGFFGLQDWDVGGICLTGVDGRGTLWDQNFIHDANDGPMKNGVYLDYAKNAVITRNVMTNLQRGIQTTGRYTGEWSPAKGQVNVSNIVAAHNTIVVSRKKGETTGFNPISTGGYNKFPQDAGRHFYNNVLTGLVPTAADREKYSPVEFWAKSWDEAPEKKEIGTLASHGNLMDEKAQPSLLVESTAFTSEQLNVRPKTPLLGKAVKVPEIALEGQKITVPTLADLGAWQGNETVVYGAVDAQGKKLSEAQALDSVNTLVKNLVARERPRVFLVGQVAVNPRDFPQAELFRLFDIAAASHRVIDGKVVPGTEGDALTRETFTAHLRAGGSLTVNDRGTAIRIEW